MMSFEELRCKFDIEKKYFFKFLQLRNFIRMSQNGQTTKPLKTNLEKLMSKDILSKGAISEFSENSDDKRLGWSEDLGEEISPEDWSLKCSQAHTKTINSQLRLLQYKWTMRTDTTPVKLNKYDNNIPDWCTKCLKEK